MEMMFLILLVNRQGVILPKEYPKEQCEEITKDRSGFCIPSPHSDYCKYHYEVRAYTTYQGTYGGTSEKVCDP